MSKKNYTPKVSKEENITNMIVQGAAYIAVQLGMAWVYTTFIKAVFGMFSSLDKKD